MSIYLLICLKENRKILVITNYFLLVFLFTLYFLFCVKSFIECRFFLFILCWVDFLKLNPLGYVPALVDGEIVIADSFAILMVTHFLIFLLRCLLFMVLID